MLRNLAITLYVFFQTTLCSCSQDQRENQFSIAKADYKIEKLAKLPPEVNECSGFALAGKEALWTLNDGGNGNELLQVSIDGQLLKRQTIAGTKNKDWEDLAKDNNGHLYIGDFGNNVNARRKLTIYKIKETDLSLVGEINFTYPDQKAFPPVKLKRNFDCEAFLWRDGKLYLFSKDRGRERMVKLYTLPDAPGNYTAGLTDSLEMHTKITGADISPDGKTVALLGYGKVFLFETTPGSPIYNGAKSCLEIKEAGQAEAIAFINNTDFVFANEQRKLFKAVKK